MTILKNDPSLLTVSVIPLSMKERRLVVDGELCYSRHITNTLSEYEAIKKIVLMFDYTASQNENFA